jgi:hypothetical protein
MRIFERDGEKGWKSPRQWDYIASSIVAVFIVKKKDI